MKPKGQTGNHDAGGMVIKNSPVVSVIVKPNSSKSELIGYSSEKKMWNIAVKAAAEKDAANKELLRFMKKRTGRSWLIKTGLHSREKVLVSTTSSQRTPQGL